MNSWKRTNILQASARAMYAKCGFNFKFEYPGYTDIMCVELVRKGK